MTLLFPKFPWEKESQLDVTNGLVSTRSCWQPTCDPTQACNGDQRSPIVEICDESVLSSAEPRPLSVLQKQEVEVVAVPSDPPRDAPGDIDFRSDKESWDEVFGDLLQQFAREQSSFLSVNQRRLEALLAGQNAVFQKVWQSGVPSHGGLFGAVDSFSSTGTQRIQVSASARSTDSIIREVSNPREGRETSQPRNQIDLGGKVSQRAGPPLARLRPEPVEDPSSVGGVPSNKTLPDMQVGYSKNVLHLQRSGSTVATVASRTPRLTFINARERVQCLYSQSIRNYRVKQTSSRSTIFKTYIANRNLLGLYDCVCVRKLVQTDAFTFLTAFLVLANAVVIGVEINREVLGTIKAYDQRLSGRDTSFQLDEYFHLIDRCFVATFAMELVLRVLGQGFSFLLSSEWKWNLFDAVLVISSLLQLALLSVGPKLTFVRTLRLMRMFRSLRVIRIFRFAGLFKHCRLMFLAILHAAVPLFWSCFFMIFILFIFSVFLLEGVATHIRDASGPDATVDELKLYYNSLSMTLLTLFMSVTGGVSWWEVAQPLLNVSVGYLLLFLTFVVLLLLAAMNIFTGIFVNEAVSLASQDSEFAQQEEEAKNRAHLVALHSYFKEADSDGSGTISREEYRAYMHSWEGQKFLNKVGLDVSDEEAFFREIDVDGNGLLELDEFVVGCMHLLRGSKAIDMASLAAENRRMMKWNTKKSAAIRADLKTIKADMEELRRSLALTFPTASMDGPTPVVDLPCTGMGRRR